MRILNLSPYYEPEVAASLYIFDNIREAYIAGGHEVLLCVPSPSRGIPQAVRKQYAGRKYEEKLGGQLKIYRFPLFSESKYPVSRAIRYFCCNAAHIIKGLFAKNIDLITIGSTPPTQGAVAAIIKQVRRVPVVYYLQDIFPDSLVSTGLAKKGSLVWKVGRLLENYTYRHMDKIIVISESFKQNIISKGVPESKVNVIYNWVDEQAVTSVDRSDNKLFDRYGLDRSKFYVVYSGNIGMTQNMDLLLQVAKELEYHEDIAFVVVGDGAYRPKVEALIKESSIRNVILLPFQPYEDISYVFSLGDIGLVISKENVSNNSVPSKTWSIMSAGRPVLASFDLESELCSIIKRADCGICVPAGDKDALREAILSLRSDSSRTRRMGQNGRRFVLENLTRNVGTSRYLAVIEQFANRGVRM